jgi:CubicO group peptidase (beta-lactamase class C family)
LLARVVEQASGTDFPRYVHDSVFTPLGMAAAQVYVGGELLSPAATSYYGTSGERVPQNLSPYHGNGDTYCVAVDLLAFTERSLSVIRCTVPR